MASTTQDAPNSSARSAPIPAVAAKKTISWNSVIKVPVDSSREQKLRSLSGNNASTQHNNQDNHPGATEAWYHRHNEREKKQIPNEAIFNTQFTTAGRMFLTKVKKNRAMHVDRRTKGFQMGLEQHTLLIDPITKRHYRLLIIDQEMQRREDLADALEPYFEIMVAGGNDRALELLTMFKVDFILLRLGFGYDNSLESSPAFAFLKEMKKKFLRTPIALLVNSSGVASSLELQKLLQKILHIGACGYFEDDAPTNVLVERLGKLLHSLVVAQTELVQCRGKSHVLTDEGEEVIRVQAIKNRGTKPLVITRPATSKPDSVTYDQQKMLLELSLNQRKQCLLKRKALTEIMDNQHSVLGVDLKTTEPNTPGGVTSASMTPVPSLVLSSSSAAPSSPGGGGFGTKERSQSVMRKIPPLPSQQEISKQMYTKPQEIQAKIHKALYESYQVDKKDALPRDPLLHHCVAIDPRSMSKSADKNLLVSKAFHLYQEKRYEEALGQCDRAIRIQSNNMVKLAYLLRGVLYDECGQFAQAEDEFRMCIKLDAQCHQAYFNLSVSRLKQGKDDEALQDLSMALQIDPQNEIYLKNRALIYRRMGLFGLAQGDYSKLETSTSGNTLTVNSLAATSAGGASTLANALSKCDMENGLYDHLFGKPTNDKLALVCPPANRTPEMIDCIVARLQSVLFFQDFPREVLQHVAQHMEYEVVPCGKCFTLGETHVHNFYLVLQGKLSARRKLGDFGSSVTTHHLETGMPFGCTGHTISSHSRLIADESTEIGILWPDAYDKTIHGFCTSKNQAIFKFLHQLKAFRHFSTSDLGHFIGISERKRFRKGEVILEQNEIPGALFILWKGSCLMYQDFRKPPLYQNDQNDREDEKDDDHSTSSEEEEHGTKPQSHSPSMMIATPNSNHNRKVLPFHRLIAKPNWPLGFQTRQQTKNGQKYGRNARRNALSASKMPSAAVLLAEMQSPTIAMQRQTLKSHEKNALIQTLAAPAIFGESAFLPQQHMHSKCSIVADSIVEMLLFDHLRLQEMDLAAEVIQDILEYAPKYLDERQVVKQQLETESWNEYKNLRVLELSKSRWPQAKRHLRMLSNGCSIMLAHASPPNKKMSTS